MTAQRFSATYLIETPLEPARVAEVMAGEQSCGTFTRVHGETDELRARARATVVQIDELAAAAEPQVDPVAQFLPETDDAAAPDVAAPDETKQA